MANKNNYFFDNFIACAECSCRMCTSLQEILSKFNANLLPARLKELHKIEHKGDSLRHEMISELTKAFITPIEREDILTLSKNIDNVTDNIEDVAIRLYTNNITQLRNDIIPFVDLLIETCAILKAMMQELGNFRKSKSLREYIDKINDLEEKGDTLYINSLRKLHSSTQNAVDIIIWREIYNCLEKCFDACETVANSVQWVMIRNA